jgi:low temperature requirement protein LtrA
VTIVVIERGETDGGGESLELGRYRYFWQRPRSHREIITERRVSFLELFYDLIYVVLIARVALGLHDGITAKSVAVFAILFGLLWIGWYNGSLLHDAHGRADMRNRLMTFLQMFAIAAMAVFAPVAAGTGGRGFAICYTAFLAILVWQWVAVARLESLDPVYGPLTRRYATTMGVMTAWIAMSVFASPDVRIWMWGGFVVVFVFGVLLFAFTERGSERETQAAAPLATESLLERFALFLIIVLGEVVASVVTGLGGVEDLTARVFLTGFVGLAVAIAFWWTYFDLIAMRTPVAKTKDRYLYNLAQLPLCLALTGVGAATVSLIEHGSDESTPSPTAWLFGGAVALAMVTAAWMMRLLDDYTRLMSLYRPAAITSLMIAALALVLAVIQPPPLLLAGTLFAAMCVQWVYSVNRWLETPEGLAKLAGSDELSG